MSDKTGRSILILSCAVLLIVVVYGAESVHGLAFDTITTDVGSVPEGREIHATFTFRNQGILSAAILDVGGSCNNVFVSLLNGPTIASGEIGAVEARVGTAGAQGRVMNTLIVRVKDPLERTVVLTVKALIEREFAPESSIVDFGQVPLETTAQRRLTIRLNSVEHTVVSARSTDASFDAHLDTRELGGVASVVVRTKSLNEPGLKFGTIRVSTSSPHMPELIVPVRVLVSSRF
jgi:hypothetical protein